MKYIDTAHTVRELIEILKQVPDTATITLNAVSAGYNNTVEVWYDEVSNDIEIT